jgi:hypothetical protein
MNYRLVFVEYYDSEQWDVHGEVDTDQLPSDYVKRNDVMYELVDIDDENEYIRIYTYNKIFYQEY